jgi:hypothetical protein
MKGKTRKSVTDADRQQAERTASLPVWTAVLMVVGALTGCQADDATPSDVAAGFVEAYGAYDFDAASSYLAADADILGLGVDTSSGDDFRLWLSLLEAEGYSHVVDDCEERSSTDTGTTIRCTVDFHDLRSDEMGLGPYSGTYFDLTVVDGEIVKAIKNWGIAEFSPQVWKPFAAWMSANHPEDVSVMGLDENRQKLTEASIQLWEERTKEYVATQS